MAGAKQFKTHAQQLTLLEQHGMIIEDPSSAGALLRQLNYSLPPGLAWVSYRRDNADTAWILGKATMGVTPIDQRRTR